eukprot:1349331-Prorocentrum_lima.AAC.1
MYDGRYHSTDPSSSLLCDVTYAETARLQRRVGCSSSHSDEGMCCGVEQQWKSSPSTEVMSCIGSGTP